MPDLAAIVADAPQWLPVLFGSSVFGLTASLGQLVADSQPFESRKTLLADDGRGMKGMCLERRQSPRLVRTPVRVEVVDRRSGWTDHGWVVDRSAGGVGLELDAPPRIGGVLDLRPCSTPGQELWVLVVVRNCLELMDCWKIGCQFVQPPASGVKHLFGRF